MRWFLQNKKRFSYGDKEFHYVLCALGLSYFFLFLIKFKQNCLIRSEPSLNTSNLIWEKKNPLSSCERMYHDEKGYYSFRNKLLQEIHMILSICFFFLSAFFKWVKLSLLYQLSFNMSQPCSVQFFQHVMCSCYCIPLQKISFSMYCIFNFQWSVSH